MSEQDWPEPMAANDVPSSERPALKPRQEAELAVASYLSRWHERAQYHMSASQCEATTLPSLLALADAEDMQRWNNLSLGYTDPRGAIWLRAAIASVNRRVGVEDIVCFAGAQEALHAALHALLDPGDHAIIMLPNYPAVETLALGLCDVSGVALDAENGWSLDVDAVAAAIRPSTRLLAISFPNNPTGYVPDQERFAALVALCRRHGIWLLSDEVYRLSERDGSRRLPQAADIYERGLSLCALSKVYGLPGLRVGWIACRDRTMIMRLAVNRQYLSTCNASPSEVLACVALKAAPVLLARNRALAEANLRLLEAFLDRHRDTFTWTLPLAGVVGYVRYHGPGTVEAWAANMVQTAGVLLLPSTTFASRLLDLPRGRFRIGFGRSGFEAGLQVLERQLSVRTDL